MMPLLHHSLPFQRRKADMPCWNVLSEEEGQRLDRILARLMPGVGLRGRRRACSSNMVAVNGRVARESLKVRAGDRVELFSSPFLSLPKERNSVSELPKVLEIHPHFAFVYKPAGLHTLSLAGRPNANLEQFLPNLLNISGAKLLNRLDYPTSGIVITSLDRQGESLYRQEENLGRVKKVYLALLEGLLQHPVLADMPLDGNGRERVRILPGRVDPLRQTRIRPLAWFNTSELSLLTSEFTAQNEKIPSELTLAECSITKGSRHQIRAHCATLGFPLMGDRRYGSSLYPKDPAHERFFLHNALVIFKDFSIHANAPWVSLLEKNFASCSKRMEKWRASFL